MLNTAQNPSDLFCTPEQYFVPNPAVSRIEVDALYCALLRAEAIVVMLQGQFNGSGDVQYNNEIIANALWAVEGCIEQAKAITLQPSVVRQGGAA
ncbi:hypothetical protein [Chitinibacter sp. GC72]|uniref:hypothetical protein n=1 Tax=Chitinibacter sp. GC72 TaxID=1526917 RepID=UPI0012FB4AB5|nr:hypothetical protein [Chitinibacter sp. GC72]